MADKLFQVKRADGTTVVLRAVNGRVRIRRADGSVAYVAVNP